MQSSTPDWKLKAFHWLPLERWTVDNLIGPNDRDKGYCKVCDLYVPRADQEDHVTGHIVEEKDRVARERAAAAAEREKQREFERQEKEALRGTPADPRPPKKQRTNTSTPRAPRQDRSGAIPLLEAALKKAGEATAASLAQDTGLDVGVVRSQIKKVPGMKIVGEVKSGGRGRPALIYGLSKSTTKEG